MNIMNTATTKRPIFNGRELIMQRHTTPVSLAQTVDTIFASDGSSYTNHCSRPEQLECWSSVH